MMLRRRKTAEAPPPPQAERPRDAFEAAWPFNSDSPIVADVFNAERFLSILLVDVTGLDWEGVEEHLPTIQEIAAKKEMVPVLIVDLLDYGALATAQVAYDTLPNASANAPLGQDLDWLSYIARRRKQLREKWRPAAIITLGPAPEWDTP